MAIQLDRDSVYSIKIYFLQPLDSISIVIDALVRLEFEAYSVSRENCEELLEVLGRSIRNVVFISVFGDQEVDLWLKYVDRLKLIENTHIIVGAFVFNAMSNETRFEFLSRNVPVITFNEIKENTLGVLKKVLFYFEATGKRKYIRVKAAGKAEIYLTFSHLRETFKGEVVDISAYAFSCTVPQKFRQMLSPGEVFRDVFLVLHGARIKVEIKMLGFSKADPGVFMFKYVELATDGDKMIESDRIPSKTRARLHGYIRYCLQANLAAELDALKQKRIST